MNTGRLPDSAPGVPNPRLARFGIFELDLIDGKLTRNGYPVKLQQQPAQLLMYLVQRAGSIVTRNELQTALWPIGTYVEFDDSLNTAMNRIRRTLGDSAAAPRYIETIPKQGYRFVAPLEYVFEQRPADSQAQTPPAQRTSKRPVVLALAAVMALAMVAVWRMQVGTPPAAGPPIRYTINLPQGQTVEAIAISPGGDQIVYQALTRGGRMLYRRLLSSEESRPMPGTENAEFPFFSPDGAEVGFYLAGKLKAAGSSGFRDISVIPPGFAQPHAFWTGNAIYFNSVDKDGVGVWRIPQQGGSAQRVLASVVSDDGVEFVFGHQLIDPQVLLYSTVRSPLHRSVKVLNLVSHESQTLVERGMGGIVIGGQYLLYYWQGSLLAAPFDVRSRKVTGSAVEVLKNVAVTGWAGPAAAVSRTGTLAYFELLESTRTLNWIDRSGKQAPLPIPAAAYEQAMLSPDGSRVAIVRKDGPELWTTWVYDLHNGSWTRMLQSRVPRPRLVWSPDGRELAVSYAPDNVGFVNVYRIAIERPEVRERLTEQPNLGQFPTAWSAQANTILFVEGVHPATFGDILALPLAGTHRPHRVVATPGWDTAPAFSPDGKRIAYASEAKGRLEVFVEKYSQPASPVQVSKSGGQEPLWAADGRRLFFLSASRALMEAEVGADGRLADPVEIVSAPFADYVDIWTRSYNVARDGRFLALRRTEGPRAAESRIHVVVNWLDELRRLLPRR